MYNAKAYSAESATSPMASTTIARRDLTEHDVQIEILFCGICHSDLHQVRDEWKSHVPTVYPCVPGHEIVGRVTRVGSAVTTFKPGDLAAVGCLVDSDGTCPQCKAGLEQFCPEGTFTYNSVDKHLGGVTYGGYSDSIVVNQHFALRVPSNLDLAGAAPLLCAGITTYSPLREVGVGKGSRVAVMGLGGLGHMAVKLAASFGAEVTVMSRSPEKEADARALGAHEFVLTRGEGALAPLANRYDVIIDTISAKHDLNGPLLSLRPHGTLVLLGAAPGNLEVSPFPLILGHRKMVGSLVGGLPETQEMLDHCGSHGITSDIEMIEPPQVNEAYERTLKGDVKYRFVMDCGKL